VDYFAVMVPAEVELPPGGGGDGGGEDANGEEEEGEEEGEEGGRSPSSANDRLRATFSDDDEDEDDGGGEGEEVGAPRPLLSPDTPPDDADAFLGGGLRPPPGVRRRVGQIQYRYPKADQ
jgi:hypothetical protein